MFSGTSGALLSVNKNPQKNNKTQTDVWSGPTRFGNLSNLGPTKRKPYWTKKKKKQKKKTGAFKQCILESSSFNHSQLGLKWPFDFLDTPTAPGVLQSQCIHTCYTYRLIIRLPLLMIRVDCLFTAKRTVKCWFFRKCLDNDVINLCCGKLPLFFWPLQYTCQMTS